MLPPELLKETEQTSGVPSLLSPTAVAGATSVCSDFAAAQRMIARSIVAGDVLREDRAEPEGQEQKGVKLYDDIDVTKSPSKNLSGSQGNTEKNKLILNNNVNNTVEASRALTTNGDNQHHYDGDDDIDDNDDDDENGHYEIPVACQQLGQSGDSGGSPVKTLDGSVTSTSESVDELGEGASSGSCGYSDSQAPPIPPANPPPLPPRREAFTRWPESESRLPLNGVEIGVVPPNLHFRPPLLPPRGELVSSDGACARSEKPEQSERRSDDHCDAAMSGDGDSTSYESFDEDDQETKMVNKCNVKLPKKIEKKTPLGVIYGGGKKSNTTTNKKTQRPLSISKSRSSSNWEITVPFKQLDPIEISGELYHKGKLSWNRRIVAISNGCLAMYKPDKEGARPSLVIQLTGYTAVVSEREGRRGFEVRMTHPSDDSHTFAVDFRDWANLWVEHINGTARGKSPSKYHTHLARTFSGGEFVAPALTDSKTDLTASNSNLSTGSEETGDEASKPKLRGNKVIRMGSFAYRASQFFETIGKKTTLKRKSSGGSNTTGSGTCGTEDVATTTHRKHLLSKTSSSSFGDLCNGIVEESSQVSSVSDSIERVTPNATPTSTSSLSPVFSPPPYLGGERCSVIADESPHLPVDSKGQSSSPEGRHRFLSSSSTGGESLSLGEDHLADPFEGATHKGYLSVFSSFNKRRWGRRWCVVRANTFECYHYNKRLSGSFGHGQSDQLLCWDTCELSFLLKPCVLRRAVQETGSELGLMLVEGGAEKITIEVPTEEEMGRWVRVFLTATSTTEVPEGLKQYLTEWEYDQADGGTVLQLWGLDNFVGCSSHDYEDPQEALDNSICNTNNKDNPEIFKDLNAPTCVDDYTHLIEDSSVEKCKDIFVNNTADGDYADIIKTKHLNVTDITTTKHLDLAHEKDDTDSADVTLEDIAQESDNLNNACDSNTTCSLEKEECSSSLVPMVSETVVELSGVCRTSPGTKNTDSGCFIPQNPNSDSDSGCENTLSGLTNQNPDTSADQDGGYATLSSRRSSATVKQSVGDNEKRINKPEDVKILPLQLTDEQGGETDSKDSSVFHDVCQLVPVSPSAGMVSSLVDNPDTTLEDMKQAIDMIKEQQAHTRQKRMAVHDKRQRVNSDEERLVCEKEMAALERLQENTDIDLRTLQSHLSLLEGDSLEGRCGPSNMSQGSGDGQRQSRVQVQDQGHAKRNKSGSRKKKKKRKS